MHRVGIMVDPAVVPGPALRLLAPASVRGHSGRRHPRPGQLQDTGGLLLGTRHSPRARAQVGQQRKLLACRFWWCASCQAVDGASDEEMAMAPQRSRSYRTTQRSGPGPCRAFGTQIPPGTACSSRCPHRSGQPEHAITASSCLGGRGHRHRISRRYQRHQQHGSTAAAD